ncbi:glycosyltransferase family 2 protein [Microbacterium immunditiarum]|uniref:Dolichol-phosphate mannosyltransferase n=1 Tax=Microbacterium immunditiarum TaxID=337480 RepID=A0A7Y9KMQ8_9MICO|nr:dolichol-phosphate mannosyltransferase [Microbacterium immunditiarum]
MSLVIPAYNEVDSAGDIAEFYAQILSTYTDVSFELILVDDGSTDGTADALQTTLSGVGPARIVSLSRNFGSHAGITAGFAHARGDAVLTLSADRQEPLEAIGQFLEQWHAGADIVWGLRSVRAVRKGMGETFARVFSRIYGANSDVPNYPSEGPSQILVSRAALDALNAMPELNRNVLAMAAWVGFDQRRIYFEQLPRPHGTSKWTTKRKMKLVVDSFVEFSHAPVEWVAWGGLLIGAIGGLLLILAILLAFFQPFGAAVALLSGLILIVGGMILVGIGVLGEYVWRAGDDARRRPVYVVRSIAEVGGAQPATTGDQ